MRFPKILIIPGSNRGGSVNAQLAASAHKVFSTLECEVTRISLRDYPMPIYDGDLEAQKGLPEYAVKLAKLFDAHDGIMLVSPEYNASTPAVLKNALDWVSRPVKGQENAPVPYKGKTFALGSASPGKLGGIRGLSHLRDVLTNVGATVIAEQICVGNTFEAFDDMDQLTQARERDLLLATCNALVNTARLLSLK